MGIRIKKVFGRNKKTMKTECKNNYKEFSKFVKGKKVIIVGPSAELMKREEGKNIDKFDIVIRLNSSFPLFGDIQKHFGSRTDVIYYVSAGIEKHFNHIKATYGINVLLHDKIKFLIFKKGFNSTSNKYRKLFNSFFERYHNKIKMFPAKKVTMSLKSILKSDPNMGILAIEHLLKTELKELHVIGCDFYKYPHYPKYSVLPDLKFDYNKRILTNLKNGWKQKTHHDISKQLEYLKTLLVKDKRLIIENNLKEMIFENTLKLNKPDKNNNILIPKIIHIVWIGSTIPKKYLNNIYTFERLNPKWEVRFWNDEKIKKETFLNQDIIDLMPTYAAKVDIIRLELIYKYGGIYSDCDSICLKPLDKLVNNKTCFAMSHKNGIAANGTIGAIKNHKAFKRLVFDFKGHINRLKGKSVNTLHVTGQHYITPILKQYNDFKLLDGNLGKGNRQTICSVYEKDLSNCYIYHDLAKSWHKQKNISI